MSFHTSINISTIKELISKCPSQPYIHTNTHEVDAKDLNQIKCVSVTKSPKLLTTEKPQTPSCAPVTLLDLQLIARGTQYYPLPTHESWTSGDQGKRVGWWSKVPQ